MVQMKKFRDWVESFKGVFFDDIMASLAAIWTGGASCAAFAAKEIVKEELVSWAVRVVRTEHPHLLKTADTVMSQAQVDTLVKALDLDDLADRISSRLQVVILDSIKQA